MTIKRLSKKQEVRDTSSERDVEKLTEGFIGAGGKTTQESKQHSSDDEMRFTLRIPKSMIEEIDKRRKRQVGSVSRNTWILQLISDSLVSK